MVLYGNGRLGRLLITLILCEQKVLQAPLLCLSLYFKEHRQYYYDLLNTVRTTGDWEAWLLFFAEALKSTASEGVASIQKLAAMVEAEKTAIAGLGRVASSVKSVHAVLLTRPIASARWIASTARLSMATVNKGLVYLEKLGIVQHLHEAKRNRLFVYTQYMTILDGHSP